MSTKSNVAAIVAAATLAAGVGVAGADVASTPQPATCSTDGHWPAATDGRPAGLDAGDRGGVYLWHDDGGWHLRVTHHGHDERTFSGTVTTTGTISAQRVKDERSDHVRVGPDGHELRFVFTNYGWMDGVDFTTRCAPALRVSVQGDGHELPASRIFLGRREVHPLSDPFTIQRTS